MDIDRRTFLRLAGTFAAAAVTVGCDRKSASELEVDLLNDFLSPSDDPHMNKNEIEGTLYDIARVDDNDRAITGGRATYLGDNLFLTNSHVIDGGVDDLRVLHQSRRGYVFDGRRPFEVIAEDSDADIALIRTNYDGNRNPEGVARMHLGPKVPDVGDDVSTFIRMVGTPSEEGYEFEFGGRDFFDQTKEVERLGKLVVPAGSPLYEKQGYVLRHDEDFLSGFSGNYEGSEESHCFTSVPGYNGEGGEPVFLRAGEDKYTFAGIVNEGIGIRGDRIQTPGHPLGYKEMQQTGVIFVHRDAIEKMIVGYINQVSGQ